MTLLIIISVLSEVDDSFNDNDGNKKNNQIVFQMRY